MVIYGIIAVSVLLIVICSKIKENQGLPHAFGKRIINRPHGILISANFLTIAPTERFRRLVAMRVLAACGVVAFACFMIALLFLGTAEAAFTLTQSTVGFWCIIATTFFSRKVHGLLWGLFYALLGGTLLGVLAALPFIIFMATTQLILPIDAMSGLLFLCFSFGMSICVYIAPAHCMVKRTYEDGYSDLLRVSSYSSAYRKLYSIAVYSDSKTLTSYLSCREILKCLQRRHNCSEV